MTEALIVTDYNSPARAVLIAEGLTVTAAGSGALTAFADWAQESNLSLDGIKSAISDPSLQVEGPFRAHAGVWDAFQFLVDQSEISSATKAAAYHHRINSAVEFRMSGMDMKAFGLRSIGRRVGAAGRGALRAADFDPDARDAEGDGLVQEGTRFERPAARRAIDRVVSAADRFERHQQGQFSRTPPPRRRRGAMADRVAARLDGVGRGVAGSEDALSRLEQVSSELQRSVGPGRIRRRIGDARENFIGDAMARLDRLGAGLAEDEALPGGVPAPQPRRRRGAPDAPSGPRAEPRVSTSALLPRSTDKSTAKLGLFDEAGFGLPQVVERGNAGIDSPMKAITHVAEGGALSEVPDDFLAEAILANRAIAGDRDNPIPAAARRHGTPTSPRKARLVAADMGPDDQRFIQMGVGGGINGMIRLYDRETGQFIGVKFDLGKASGVNEDIGEVLGAHVAERLGFNNGVMRWGGVAARNPGRKRPARPIVVEMVQNYGSEQLQVGGEVRNWEREGVMDDFVSHTLLDFAIRNTDRHYQNYFVTRDAEGRNRFIPFDHGYSLNEGDRMGRPHTLKGWLATYGSKNPAHGEIRSAARRGEEGRQSVIEAIRRAQDQLREADSAKDINLAIQGILDQTGHAPTQLVESLPDRLAWIRDTDPADILEEMIAA